MANYPDSKRYDPSHEGERKSALVSQLVGLFLLVGFVLFGVFVLATMRWVGERTAAQNSRDAVAAEAQYQKEFEKKRAARLLEYDRVIEQRQFEVDTLTAERDRKWVVVQEIRDEKAQKQKEREERRQEWADRAEKEKLANEVKAEKRRLEHESRFLAYERERKANEAAAARKQAALDKKIKAAHARIKREGLKGAYVDAQGNIWSYGNVGNNKFQSR